VKEGGGGGGGADLEVGPARVKRILNQNNQKNRAKKK